MSGSKQIQQLSGHEIVYLCDWATDYMGGELSNQEGSEPGESIGHRCPGSGEEDGEETYVRFNYADCPELLADYAVDGCTITVSQFEGWIRAAADEPCEEHYLGNSECEFVWGEGGNQ